MNICFIIYGDRPDYVEGGSGTGISLWKLSLELVNQGCAVHIIYKINSSLKLPGESQAHGVYFHGVSASSSSALSRLTFGFSALKMIHALDEKYAFDIFSFHGACSTSSIMFLRKQTSKPIVYHEYGATPLVLKEVYSKVSPPANLVRLTLDSILEYAALKYVDKIVVASLNSKREFRMCYNYPEKRIGIMPLGQDLVERCGYTFSAYPETSTTAIPKRKLLLVGNDWYRKGVKYLFLALKEVQTAIPDVKLKITGSPQRPFVLLAENLKIKNNVEFVGNVDEVTLCKLYDECDVFVLPSFHEGFSNTLIEAMAFGKPVVTTPIAGYPVIENGKDGFLIPPGDSSSLAFFILKLLSDKQLYSEMSKNAFAKASKYTWHESAKTLITIYSSLRSENQLKPNRHLLT